MKYCNFSFCVSEGSCLPFNSMVCLAFHVSSSFVMNWDFSLLEPIEIFKFLNRFMIIKCSRFDARRLSLDEINRFQFPQVPLYHLQGIKIPAKEKTINQGKTTKMIFYFYHKNYIPFKAYTIKKFESKF